MKNNIRKIFIKILSVFIFFCSYYILGTHIVSLSPIIANFFPIILPSEKLKKAQQEYYVRAMINMMQGVNGCTKPDITLGYKTKDGDCPFNNFEFSTLLKFSNDGAVTENIGNKGISLIVVGDSHAMGWGVSYNETFSYLLSKEGYTVKNYAVASYGTEQEILSAMQSPHFKSTDYLIIQYCNNDIGKNQRLFNEYREKDYNYHANLKESELSFYDKLINALKLYFKEYSFTATIKLPWTLFQKNKESGSSSGNLHHKYFFNILKKYPELKDKKIIVFYSNARGVKFLNWEFSEHEGEFPNVNLIDFQLDQSDYYKLDDHLNKQGHLKVAKKLNLLIQKIENLKSKKNDGIYDIKIGKNGIERILNLIDKPYVNNKIFDIHKSQYKYNRKEFSVNKKKFTVMNSDPKIFLDKTKVKAKSVILAYKINSKVNTSFQLFYKLDLTSSYGIKNFYYEGKIKKGYNEIYLKIPSTYINNVLRIDFVNRTGVYEILDLSIYEN